MTLEQIKIAVVLPDISSPPNWIMRLVSDVHLTEGLRLSALIGPTKPPQRPSGNRLFRFWLWLERRLAANVEPLGEARFRDACNEVPILHPSDETEISRLKPDVIIDLSGNQGLSCDPLFARFGVWFLDCDAGDETTTSIRPIIGPEPVSRFTLFRRTHGDGKPCAVASGRVNTKFIAARNAVFLLEKSVGLVLRELTRLRLQGSVDETADGVFIPVYRVTLPEILRYIVGLAGTSLRRVIEKIQVHLRLRPGMFFLKTLDGEVFSFDPAEATSHIMADNAYQADPFLWRRDSKTWVFFETFDYSSNLGHISAGLLCDNRLENVRTALRRDYHLSFPFLFEDEEELFMMPETCAVKRLEVWRCTRFPDQWELHATALEGIVAADSSLAKIDDQWWLFSNISSDAFGDVNSELHVFQVDGPALREIVPHSLNPVVIDSRTARNAGRILCMNGAIYRPSQDNSHGLYGYGVNIMHVEKLSLAEYSESLVRRIEPDFEPGIIGCHHLDFRDGQIIFDARKKLGGRGR